jgi:ribosome-associated protein
LEITPEIAIDDKELRFTASRSGGPGGQNVNKVSTRVTLFFDVAGSQSLDEAQKRRILTRLAGRASKDGVLRVVCQRHRSQAANREGARERFLELLRWALSEAPERRPTRPTRTARERRLADKKRRARLKQARAAPPSADE